MPDLASARFQQERAARAAAAAVEEAALAAARQDELARAAAARNPRPPGPARWRRLAVTVLGTGVLLGVFTLGVLATVFLLSTPFLIVPPAAALAGVVIVVRRSRGEVLTPRPSVRDLARAELEVRAAQAVVRRARERVWATDRLVQLCRAHHAETRRRRERRSEDASATRAALARAQRWVDRHQGVDPPRVRA